MAVNGYKPYDIVQGSRSVPLLVPCAFSARGRGGCVERQRLCAVPQV
jgi:hypothetical protein